MGRPLAILLCTVGCASVGASHRQPDERLRAVTVYVLGCGTGWLVDERHVVTNAHVTACANQRTLGHAEVLFGDGLRVGGHPLWQTRPRFVDLAVIELNEDVPRALPRLGDPSALARGEAVVSLGRRQRHFTTRSYVVLARPEHVEGGLDGVIVLDAPARRGESGSPLVTLDGQVIGVLFASTRQNAYAVPVRPYLTDLLGQLPHQEPRLTRAP